MLLISKDFEKEIKLRITKVIDILKTIGCDSVLIGANPNIYYTTGRFFRGYVYISIQNQPLWFIIKPNVFEETSDTFYIRKPEDIPTILRRLSYNIPNKIGLEINDLSYSDILRLKKLFGESEMENGSLILKKARMAKTSFELNEMKEDGFHHVRVYEKVKDCYKAGMSDLQLQIEIEKNLRLEGSLGISRISGNFMEINMGSVISGDNADNPAPYEFTMGGSGVHPSLPVGSDNSLILPGKTVMIDMNGAFNGYQTDMTRVWSLGDLPPIALKAHECSLKILRKLEYFSLPGTPVKELYSEALKIVEDYGLKEYFMGHKSQVGFIGHGIGIELNELPVINSKSTEVLEENFTLAIEPKFVIPGVGAAGVENTYIVTNTGLQNITVFPEDIQYFT